MRVFITGGSGLIGSQLVWRLRERGDDVIVLTRSTIGAQARLRNQESGIRNQPPPTLGTLDIIEGNPAEPAWWMNSVAGCQAVVNLAGENLFAHRWNEDFKKLLRDSRIKSTENVVEAVRRAVSGREGESGGEGEGERSGSSFSLSPSRPLSLSPSLSPLTLINGSAIGYYGPTGDEELSELSPPGHDFLAQLCMGWEAAAAKAEAHGARVVMIRTGVILDRTGGALKQMLLPFKLGVGGRVGSGKQWMSWIHIEDEVGLILFAIDNPEVRGPMNATAPQPVTNYEFTKALGAALHRPTILPTPTFALRLKFGEVADVITTGQRILPRKAQELGYRFKYPEINAALGEIFAREM